MGKLNHRSDNTAITPSKNRQQKNLIGQYDYREKRVSNRAGPSYLQQASKNSNYNGHITNTLNNNNKQQKTDRSSSTFFEIE